MKSPSIRQGFTLVELLVSMALLSLVSVLLVSMTNSTASTWRYTSGKIEQFRAASNAFDAMTRRISQATLNTYWDYDSPTSPARYLRQSELRFITGQMNALSGTTNRTTQGIFFQAPLGYVDDTTDFSGMENLLNTWGFYVEFNKDTRPAFINALSNPPPSRYRFRLMEMMEPSNKLTLYSLTSGTSNKGYNGTGWFTTPLTSTPPPVHVLAENIIALVILPKLSPGDQAAGNYTDGSLAPNYAYDSTGTNSDPNLNPLNQLPPVVQVTMVAVDEASYNRFQSAQGNNSMPASLVSGTSGTLFQTVGDTTNSSNTGYAQDLQTLETALRAGKLNYRIFTSNISIRGAKWSRN